MNIHERTRAATPSWAYSIMPLLSPRVSKSESEAPLTPRGSLVPSLSRLSSRFKPKPSSGYDERAAEENAATMMQARQRGNLARKLLGQPCHEAEGTLSTTTSAKDEHAAAVMQAGLRGYLARRRRSGTNRDSAAAGNKQLRASRWSNEEGSLRQSKGGRWYQRTSNPFEGLLTAKARMAQKASHSLVRARMKVRA